MRPQPGPPRQRATLCTRMLSVWGLAALFALLATPTSAQRYPGRELVLPAGHLRVDMGPRWVGPPAPGTFEVGLKHPDPIDFNFGLSVSPADGFQLGAVLVPVQLAPHTDYQQPSVHALFGLSRGAVQSAFLINFVLPTEDDTEVDAGFPLQIQLADFLRLDLAAIAQTRFDPFRFHLWLPAELAVGLGQKVFLGAGLGLWIVNLIGEADADVAVPLSLFGGYSLDQGDFRLQLDLGDAAGDVDVYRLMARLELWFGL